MHRVTLVIFHIVARPLVRDLLHERHPVVLWRDERREDFDRRRDFVSALGGQEDVGSSSESHLQRNSHGCVLAGVNGGDPIPPDTELDVTLERPCDGVIRTKRVGSYRNLAFLESCEPGPPIHYPST